MSSSTNFKRSCTHNHSRQHRLIRYARTNIETDLAVVLTITLYNLSSRITWSRIWFFLNYLIRQSLFPHFLVFYYTFDEQLELVTFDYTGA